MAAATWKQYATSKGLQPFQAWRALMPHVERASPKELERLWEDDDWRAWIMAEIDAVSAGRKVPM